jgi:hypothetical protein
MQLYVFYEYELYLQTCKTNGHSEISQRVATTDMGTWLVVFN